MSFPDREAQQCRAQQQHQQHQSSGWRWRHREPRDQHGAGQQPAELTQDASGPPQTKIG